MNDRIMIGEHQFHILVSRPQPEMASKHSCGRTKALILNAKLSATMSAKAEGVQLPRRPSTQDADWGGETDRRSH